MRKSALIVFSVFSALSGSTIEGAAPAKGQSPQIRWDVFVHPSGDYQVSYPLGWDVRNQGDSVVFASPGSPEIRGSFGVIKRLYAQETENVLKKRLEEPDRPMDLKRMPATFAGVHVTKVVGTKKDEPSKRVVEYYIDRGPNQYLAVCVAPKDQWQTYSPIFERIILSFQFGPSSSLPPNGGKSRKSKH